MSDADDLFELADRWFLAVKEVPAETPVVIPARDLLRLTAAVFQRQDQPGARCAATLRTDDAADEVLARCILPAGHAGRHQVTPPE